MSTVLLNSVNNVVFTICDVCKITETKFAKQNRTSAMGVTPARCIHAECRVGLFGVYQSIEVQATNGEYDTQMDISNISAIKLALLSKYARIWDECNCQKIIHHHQTLETSFLFKCILLHYQALVKDQNFHFSNFIFRCRKMAMYVNYRYCITNKL